MNRIFLAILLFCWLIVPPAYAAESWQGVRNDEGMLFYSSMGYIAEEGEYSGLEIIILPYNPQYGAFKYKVLLRSGNGYLDTPLLLDATVHGKELKVTVPPGYDGAGEWVLIPDRNSLFAQDPIGNRYLLKKVTQTTSEQ